MSSVLPDEPITSVAAGREAPRVFYDGQAFLSPNLGTGKGVYLRNLIAPYAHRFTGLATPGETFHQPDHLIQEGFSRYHLWHQLSVPRMLQKYQADYFLAPYNTAPFWLPERTRLILILHDLILLNRPDERRMAQRLDNEFRRLLIPRAVSRAHIVVTVSSYVKQEIEVHFPSAKVRLIPNTIAAEWFAEDDAIPVLQRENFILTVTSNVPHKNTSRTLQAYARYVTSVGRQRAPRLRVVGLGSQPAEFIVLARDLDVETLIDFQPLLAEGELRRLYRSARAVLVPSLAEGFGITALEGMASGTPILVSDRASLPEVAGPAASYFDPTDINSIASTLEEVLANRSRQEQMIREGIIQANRFHPAIVGKQIRSFWDELLAH